MSCPCGNSNSYESCCALVHENLKNALTSEALMRARYTAFVKSNIDFIGSSHIPGTSDFDPKEAKEWAENSIWEGLEILKTQKGGKEDSQGMVEFKAKYKDKDEKEYLHHEIATFKKVEGLWYYEDGQIVGLGPLTRTSPKIGRNDPCSCGSGKKFKKCCGK